MKCFLGIGTDNDHVHFLIQATPELSPSEIIRTVKSVTAKRVFKESPKVKKKSRPQGATTDSAGGLGKTLRGIFLFRLKAGSGRPYLLILGSLLK